MPKHRVCTATLTAVFLGMSSTLGATTIVDPSVDFTPTYTGAPNADLDIVSASVEIVGGNLVFGSTSAGAIGASPGSLFVWGINRGQGTARLAPSGAGAFVLFDALAVLFPDGVVRAVTFPVMGPPTIAVIPGAASISGNSIGASLSASLFPSTGFALRDYRYTLWSRLRINPAMDGAGSEIADFAPSDSSFAAVPEPATWAMMIMGFGLIGGALRRRGAIQALPATSNARAAAR